MIFPNVRVINDVQLENIILVSPFTVKLLKSKVYSELQSRNILVVFVLVIFPNVRVVSDEQL